MTPQSAPSLLEQLSEAFILDLMTGKIRPGERLGEESLGLRWNVSRVPVREMFMRMESDGLLERRPNQGTFIRQFSDEEKEELWALRTAIESLVVQRATVLATPEQIEKLLVLAKEVDAADGSVDIGLCIRTELAFHNYLCEVGHLRHAARLIRMQQLLANSFRLALDTPPKRTPPPDEHSELVRAIATGDVQHAMEVHRQQASHGPTPVLDPMAISKQKTSQPSTSQA